MKFAIPCVTLILAIVPAKTTVGDEAEPSTKYLEVVRRTTDALLDNAVDTYGVQKSGMILSVLDRRTAKPLQSLPTPPYGVRAEDRTGPGGSNANLQQDLYRTMHHLSRLTGDPKYTTAAHTALVDFLRMTQHPETGLVAWGEHLYWNCLEDRLGDAEGNRFHEPKRKFIFFEELYEAEPDRTLRFARGLWEHQIGDHQTGNFSRHAGYDKHRPGLDMDFPKEASYFLCTWSEAYRKTRDPYYTHAVHVMATRYLNKLNDRNLLSFDSTTKPKRVNKCVPLWMISMAIEADDAARRIQSGPTVDLLNTLAGRHDKGFLGLPHAPGDPKRGFVFFAYTDTGLVRPDEEKQTDGYSRPWAMGYGVNTTAMFATLIYTRQAQLGTSEAGDAYRKLLVQAADLYCSVEPDPQKQDIWAGEYGLAIFTELAAYRLTNDGRYLATAQKIADHAIKDLWDGGNAVLPRASTRTDYYDVISYADTTLLALLALHEQLAGIQPLVPISDITR